MKWKIFKEYQIASLRAWILKLEAIEQERNDTELQEYFAKKRAELQLDVL